MVTTTLSFAIISSMLISPSACVICVRLSSPNFSLISVSSSLMIVFCLSGLAKISFKSAISNCNSSYSVLTFSLSRPVSFCSLISKIALACASVNKLSPSGRKSSLCKPIKGLNCFQNFSLSSTKSPFINFNFASSGVLLFLMSVMTLSI